MDYYKFCERYQQRCAARRAELEEDELLLRRSRDFRRRDLHDKLIFKTYEAPPPPSEPATDWSILNEWLRENVENALDNYSVYVLKHLAEVLAQERRSMRKHVSKELGELRTEIEILRSVVKAGNVEQFRKTNVG
jgi:hypothetical protein